MTEVEARQQAKKEAKFYTSLAAYVVVNLGLIAVNLLTSPSYLWFVWPLLGWGLGLTGQAFQTFGGRRQGGWIGRRTMELMGPEASETRLRQLLDEELDERALPAGAPQDVRQLQRRIEHLEAIVTTQDWDVARQAAPRPDRASALDLDAFDDARLAVETPRLDVDGLDLDAALDASGGGPAESASDRVARLARRVG